MRKKELVKTAFFLVLYSFIAKILSLFVRILIARTISEEAMTLYSVAAPTMIIMITLAQMGIPAALSKILAEKNGEKRRPMTASILLAIANNILLTILFVMIIPLLSVRILKQQDIQDVLLAIVPLLPLVTMTGLCKGYYIGQHQHNPPAIAQIVEETLRALFILILFGRYDISSPKIMAIITMLSVSVGEIGSLLTLILFLPNRKRKWNQLAKHIRTVDRSVIDAVLSISMPMTGSRLVGSLTYFMEPLILVNRSLHVSDTMSAYGQLNGYVLPIITMPSFLTLTLAGWLLPTFTYQYSANDIKKAKRTFLIISSLCLGVGVVFGLFSYAYPHLLMQLLYKKSIGIDTLKWLAFPFMLYTMQPVLSSVLHGMNRSKQTFLDTLVGSLVRLLVLFAGLPLLGDLALPLALTAGMMTTTMMHGWRVMSVLFFYHK